MTSFFTILGARGTMSVSGRPFVRYGCHTTSFSLETEQGILVIDAGTGITALSDRLPKTGALPPITLLFTHFHLDHVVALPLFRPLYNARAQITLFADGRRDDPWRTTVQTIAGKPYWPVELRDSGARIRFQDLPDAADGLELHGVRVTWCPVRHPQQCLAYRLQTPERTIVIATDREHGHARMDDAFLAFCQDADVLIYDAQYLPAEYPAYRGWGHSTWEEGVRAAQEAGVRELILTHHDRDRSDDQLDAMVERAARLFPATRGAQEGLVVGRAAPVARAVAAQPA